MNQLSLFETRAPPEKSIPPPPKQPRFRLPLERRVVRKPCGKADGRGKFFYQKMHAVLEEMPEEMRERFNDLTYLANFQHVESFAKALRLYCSGTAMDHLDFDVSRGALGE